MNTSIPYSPEAVVRWPELIKGVLIKRYKRFCADVRLCSGETVTAHCPNSGSMTGCADPERPVYLSLHDNPKRKLKYTWELIEMPHSLVGVNTLVPNRLVSNSISAGVIPELADYAEVRREVNTGNGSRIDLMLNAPQKKPCYVEIKNCTLVNEKMAQFPDAVTMRGKKHLLELQALASQGARCVMFYLIQRMDAEHFKPASHIDPAYAEELARAYKNGVEILCYDVHIDLRQIRVRKKIPFSLD